MGHPDITGSRISRFTVSRILAHNGIHNRIARTKPFISKTNQQKRLTFAREHANWTVEDWKNVMFSDESSFELGKQYSHRRVNRRDNKALLPQNMVPTFRSGRSSVMIWGAVSGHTKTDIFIKPQGETMKATDYKAVLLSRKQQNNKEVVI